MTSNTFARQIIDWHQLHGRHDLPWQHCPTPYRVWISEIMLQQTQVKTVIPYFEKFMGRYPTVHSLAIANIDEVLSYWSGLGYYARARNLHQTAQIIQQQYYGKLPNTIEELCNLPGIGRSTAGAILSLANHQIATILDGNVKRILCRIHAVEGWPGDHKVLKVLWSLAEQYTPTSKTAVYNQALMDLGATVCTRRQPNCGACPVNSLCQVYARQQQDMYPYTKPRKSLPLQKTIMLLLENHQHKLLLIKRPPTGIWGGLWSLPQCEIETNIELWVKHEYSLKILKTSYLPVFTHQFTHFRLLIQPILLKTQIIPHAKIMEQTSTIWYNNQQTLAIGLAKPVQALINHYFEQGGYKCG